MSSYILVGHNYPDKKWWNEIVRACAIVGDPFEIHCWSDESAEVKAALQFGHRVTSTWREGTVIRGRITKEFLSYLDVLVDGPFVMSKKDLTLRFRGSSNQRLIDVPASLREEQIVLWEDWQGSGRSMK